MIQIQAIHIQEFRGIRDLQLTPNCKSFVIWGPNGSGKSGVVDAIGFALTGDIARLRGAGSGGLTVAKHGPHVHRRDDPGAAKVSLTVRDTASGKSAVLTRSVKTARIYTLSPDIPEVRAAVDWAQQHPELTLSRREVIKYIITEPGARAQAVQALLKLDRLEGIRGALRTAQSKTTTAEKSALAAVNAAEQAVRRHLDLPSLLTSEVTSEINKRRVVLGLDAFEAVSQNIDLAEDVNSDPTDGAFNKVSAIRDVQALAEWLDDGATLGAAVGELSGALDDLDSDPDILASIQLRSFVDRGLSLVTSAVCPLCDTDWQDVDSLRAHLAGKIARFDTAEELQRRIRDASGVVVNELRRGREFVRSASPHTSFGAAELQHRLQSWSDDLVAVEQGSVTANVCPDFVMW